MNPARERSLVIFALPILICALMSATFWTLSQLLGQEIGYLLGFGFYWLFWCLLLPRWLLGKTEFAAILRDRAPLFCRANWLAALLWLTVTLVSVWMYAGEFLRAPLTLILLAAPLATLNGFCEEILWRGLYVRRFPQNPWMAILYPSLGFALWHLAPQVIFPAENVIGFVVSTFFLALPYGYIAYRTGSAKWTAISHSLSGILALSGYLAPSVLALIA
jgi:hypothetical protein